MQGCSRPPGWPWVCTLRVLVTFQQLAEEKPLQRDIPWSLAAPLARDQLTGICSLPDTFFLLHNCWLHSSVFLPLSQLSNWICHMQGQQSWFWFPKARSEDQWLNQPAKALSRECDFQRRKQISKYKLNKSYITFLIPKDCSENGLQHTGIRRLANVLAGVSSSFITFVPL